MSAKNTTRIDDEHLLTGSKTTGHELLGGARTEASGYQPTVVPNESDLAAARNYFREPGRLLQPGARLDRYLIESLIGVGGCGRVYRARHLQFDLLVAIKVLTITRADFAIDRMNAFRQEARILSVFQHPNIIKLLDFEDMGPERYLVMEHVDGHSLADWIDRESPLSTPLCLYVLEKIALALKAVHEQGFLHRDVKPGNILLGLGDEVKLADFGLAMLKDGLRHRSFGGSCRLRIEGTYDYMSPEQVDGGLLDESSDLFSLGTTIYHALTGCLPFSSARGVPKCDPLPVRVVNPGIPDEVSNLVGRMLETDPDRRFADCGELLHALTLLPRSIKP